MQDRWNQPAALRRRMRDLTGNIAAVYRRGTHAVSGKLQAARHVREADAEWDDWESWQPPEQDVAESQEFWTPGGGRSAPQETPARVATKKKTPTRQPEQERGQQKPGKQARRVTGRIMTVLAVLSLVIGFCATSNVLHIIDALAAARDAKVQVAAIEAMLKTGDYFSTDSLQTIRGRLDATEVDLERVQAAIPLEPVAAYVPGASGIVHTVRMAAALVHAGQYALDAGLILMPHLKGMLSGLNDSSSTATKSSDAIPPLTMDDIAQAKQDVAAAIPLAEQALAERQGVNEDDLSRLGFGSLVPMLQKLDDIAPQLPTYLGYAQGIMDELPAILGMSKPAQYLLFLLDSDEIRPTGGFQGNYALLTLSQAKLTGGLKLHDIYTLDCPTGTCAPNPIPSKFSWYTLSKNSFHLRDSNLDPDFPTSARLAEEMFKDEGGPDVNGVFAITPAVVENVLTITGPIKVTAFNKTVTASNLQETIHYYHITNYGDDPEIAAKYETSGHKAFDAEFGSVLMQKIGTLTPAQQAKVFAAIFHGLATHDVQMYFNAETLETALTSLHLSGAIQAPQGDSLMVVDTNVSGSYVNQDIKEKITDTVTLNADGSASHNLSIQYNYPYVEHTYEAFYLSKFYLTDFVRVIVPKGATFDSLSGCSLAHTTEDGHEVWACQFSLHRTESTTLHFKWKVPHAATTAGDGSTQYQLFVQKQAGTHSTVDVKITPPSKTQFASPLQAPLKAAKDGVAEYSAAFTSDQQLAVSYR